MGAYRFSPYRTAGRMVQIGWLLFALLALSLALAGLAPYAELLRTPCAGSTCLTGQLSPVEAQSALAAGRTLSEYGTFGLAIYLFTDLALFLAAAAVIWRKPQPWATVCGAFALAAAATATLAQAASSKIPALTLPAQFLHFVQLAGFCCFFSLLPKAPMRPTWLLWAACAALPAAAIVAFAPALPGSGSMVPVMSAAVGLLILASAVVYYRSAAVPAEAEQAAWTLAAVALLAVAQWLGRPFQLLPLPAMPLERLPGGLFFFFPVFGMLLVVSALTCLAVALLGDELFRMEVALNRAVVYGLLTLFVVGAYVFVVGYLSVIFQTSGSLWLSLIATGMVAVLFQPIRGQLQRFVNRIIYGEQEDPYTVLTDLGRRLETALAPEEVMPTILHAVTEALGVSYAEIALRQAGPEGFAVAAKRGPDCRIAVDLPLIYQTEVVGRLRVGALSPGTAFSSADRRLLSDLARQAGPAIHAVQQNADLQIARQRIVTAREEERRRLRRDLHDGLGASLAALNLQAGELQRTIRSDADAAVGQAEALRGEIRAAIADIRRLVYDLRPPALDELGLVEALRARAAQSSRPGTAELPTPQPGGALQVTVEAPEVLASLPAAVEAAAYRIAVEALTNTVRHARANHCSISLMLEKRGLRVEICDDGIGLPEAYRSGIGVISMRERCAELGGTLTMTPVAGRGTRVSAWLPLPATAQEP